jgi:hypothetical protein
LFHRKETATQLVKKEYAKGFAISLQEYGCNSKINPNYPFDAEQIKELLHESLVSPELLEMIYSHNFRNFYRKTKSELLRARLIRNKFSILFNWASICLTVLLRFRWPRSQKDSASQIHIQKITILS